MEYTFDIDELIGKRLTAEIDAQEDALLEKWLQESSDNRRYFRQMEQLWAKSDAGKSTLPKPIDVEAALIKTKAKIQVNATKSSRGIVAFGSWRLAAAAALVLLAAAIWFFQSSSAETQVLLAATENNLRDTLVDGSVVALNHHSTLSATFSKKERRVNMRGEAYFEVAHDKAKPFVIAVKKVEVTVVGTKFNIDSRSDSTKVIVSVEEGRVRVQSGSEIVYLNAGEQASIDCSSGQIQQRKLAPSSNVKGWVDRRFVFDDVPLSEVIPILEDAYHVHIELKNKNLANCRLHTRFNDETIERVMELIAETFSIQIENNNGHYLLNGNGCGQ
jgi:transmembrane sensor